MIHDTDILIKLHKEAMVFLENEREDDEEEAVKKYFETFNILFDLVKRYGVKFPCHIIDKITVQQFLILKKCGVNVNSIQKLILEEDDSETSESEILQDSDSEVKINPFVSKAENPFIRGLVPIPTLPSFTNIPPLKYINALPVPSPKLPELPNFKNTSDSPVELDE